MKKIAITTAILFTICILQSCRTEVPEAVLLSFEAKYGNAQNVSWGKENKSEYEAEFSINNINMSANFDNRGDWVETEVVIEPKNAPAEIVKTINVQYSGYQIKSIESIETADKGLSYEVIITKRAKKLEIMFNETGNILEKSE
ncbi:MAG: PepSY-like domain-containing protein [Bacteroidetes bacterium]|nr:PepSY-like domain-containing protein [Bacteroidota bacterium]MBK8344941.1 PepSY-like domain-containing protein [Bacteroidota bacterium]